MSDASTQDTNGHGHVHKVTFASLLVTMGIVFGDIGTSPLYAIKAIAYGGSVANGALSRELILGGVSAVFWTLTLQTTFKYIIITLRADNNGEGGLLSLYTLIRKYRKWLIVPAMIGAAFQLADGVITPPISVSSAIEGLQVFDKELNTVPIVLLILVFLFGFQQFGTKSIGGVFGYVMLIWFTMIGLLGLNFLLRHTEILVALNPYWAIYLVTNYHGGFWLLGAVFLCTTGAEALYSDMGHVGRKNIRISWVYVKICLLLSYFGQSAFLLPKVGEPMAANMSTFYGIVPDWFMIPAIVIATLATIVASQALITGSFTLINEGIRLEIWPRLKVNYPSEIRGQLYLPAVNGLLFVGCVFVVLYFRRSEEMEAAYGLAVTLTMVMTSTLLSIYLWYRTKFWRPFIVLILLLFFATELSFFIANLPKFLHGGYVSVLIGMLIVGVMYVWHRGRIIKRRFVEEVPIQQYLPVLKELRQDSDIPKFSTHLVYLTFSKDPQRLDRRIIYSILNRQPKRADVYWLINVQVVDEPYRMTYYVDKLDSDGVFYVQFKLGFRVEPRINLFFRKVIESMVKNGEVDITSRYQSLGRFKIAGDFNFVILTSFLSYDNELSWIERLIMAGYFNLAKLALTDERSFGLDTSSVTVEKVPLIISPVKQVPLIRLYPNNATPAPEEAPTVA